MSGSLLNKGIPGKKHHPESLRVSLNWCKAIDKVWKRKPDYFIIMGHASFAKPFTVLQQHIYSCLLPRSHLIFSPIHFKAFSGKFQEFESEDQGSGEWAYSVMVGTWKVQLVWKYSVWHAQEKSKRPCKQQLRSGKSSQSQSEHLLLEHLSQNKNSHYDGTSCCSG